MGMNRYGSYRRALRKISACTLRCMDYTSVGIKDFGSFSLGFALSLLLGEVAKRGGVLEALLVKAFLLGSGLFGHDAGAFQGLANFDLHLALRGATHSVALDEVVPGRKEKTRGVGAFRVSAEEGKGRERKKRDRKKGREGFGGEAEMQM
ncbi:hypothetical protein Fmac_016085 [Flemingia macrophylla]|uniref:Uncharacterized protein n=1 Tax=Flemingia macrophylla TaxID=520843 RepID=A0ABD1MGD9_9FABA